MRPEKYEECEFCCIPHPPVTHQADCDAADERMSLEAYAVLERRLTAVLHLIDHNEIESESPGDTWRFLRQEEDDGFHSRATRELMAALKRTEIQATRALAMVALNQKRIEKYARQCEERAAEQKLEREKP